MNGNVENNLENRIFERFPSQFPAKLKDSREEFGENIYLRNASAQGAKISTKDRFYLNDSISIDIQLPDNNYPMNLNGQVVWVKDKGNDVWDIGLKFHNVSLIHISRLYKFVDETD